ncbi:MAG: YigZ family protein [Bacilli bacterium]|nr:YigZ family protein [Bacilli bacterium]
MRLINEYTYEIKKSKFIGFYYEVNSIEEVKDIINDLKKEHKKARHIPYAYHIGSLAKKTDDKEPSNTAGSPIYNVIEKKHLDNALVIVIRYFGGIKLGAGGLFRAYSHTANEVTNI